jgi:hypothetical protein
MPQKKKRSVPQQLINAANKGLVADALGGPVDLATLLMNAPGQIYGAATGRGAPYEIKRPVGGSDFFSGLLENAGMAYDDGEETSTLEDVARLGLSVAGPGGVVKGAQKLASSGGKLAPRINKAMDPVVRATRRPTFSTEVAVTEPAFMRGSEGSLNDPAFVGAGRAVARRAQEAAGGPYASGQLQTGQGAWMGSQGMETNPLYMQQLPSRPGRIDADPELLRYVAQTSKNLRQDANAAMRFVPQVAQDPATANAVMMSNVSPADIRALAKAGLGDEMVLAAQPGNRLLMTGFGDEFAPAKAVSQARYVAPHLRPTYGVSNTGQDRVFMTRTGEYGPAYDEFLLNY